MTISIYVADDHDGIIDYFKHWFTAKEGFEFAGSTQDGLKVLEEVRRTRPDVLILDVVMPGMNGLDILRELASARPSPRVLMYSGYCEMEYAAEARRHGARGFVLKGDSLDTLYRAVREVAAGRHYYSPALSASLLDYDKWVDEAAQRPAETLTPTERKILNLYAQGRTAPEIAHLVKAARRTVEHHLSEGTRKLGIPHAEDVRRQLVREALAPATAPWMRPIGPRPP